MEDKIKDGNKLIAEFLGIKEIEAIDSSEDKSKYYYSTNGIYRTCSYSVSGISFDVFINNSKYHFDWSWQIPAQSKIFKACYKHQNINALISDYGMYVYHNDVLGAFEILIEALTW